MGKLLVPAL